MNRSKAILKLTACGLAGALTVGNFTVEAEAAATAGITNYTSNIVTNSTSPSAGFSRAVNQCAASVEDEAAVASAQVNVAENEAPVVKSDYEDIAVATVTDYVHIRKKASKDSKSLGKLYTNNVGTVLGKKGDWYKIQSGSVTGYVKSDYVAVGDEKLAEKAGRRVALVNAETLKVRKKASQKAEVIGLVPEGDDLTVTDESKDGWVGVSVEEGKGYVSADYIELKTEYTYAESAEEEAARLKKEEEERQAAAAAAAAAQQADNSANVSSGSGNGSSSSSNSSSSSSGSNTAAVPAVTNGTGSAVANYACQFVGNPYRWGGTSLTNGADCSGFVMAVYAHFGVMLEFTLEVIPSYTQATRGTVSKSPLRQITEPSLQ